LSKSSHPSFEEIEMLQTWIEEFVPAEEQAGTDLVEALVAATQEFETVMSEGDTPLRPLLESDEHAGEAQRLLAREMRRRRDDRII
jgi:hypothetical protein